MIGLKNRKVVTIVAVAIAAVILISSALPAQSFITYGRWRDINPTQYGTDVTGSLRGVYVRDGGSGAIGAGDGWAVGGSTAPIISHYDGFSWHILASPVPTALYNSVSFCTSPGAPSVGLCSPNGDGSDGWIVGATPTPAPTALYWDGAILTTITANLPAGGNLTSVFEFCHFDGSGCSSSIGSIGSAVAVGANTTAGAIFYFSGNPKLSGSWHELTVTGISTAIYNSVYMYVDPAGNLGGFAVGDNGVVAQLNAGTWIATSPGVFAGTDLLEVFVDNGNPIDAWAIGRQGGIWHFVSGSWTGVVAPAPASDDLFGIGLVSTSEGWIVGGNSTILHSTTLGSSNVWLALTRPLQTATGKGITLFSASFPSSSNGWAVGTQGIILQTSNSGCGSAVPAPCWGGSTSILESAQLNTVFEEGTNDAWAGGVFDNATNTYSLIHWDGIKWHRAEVSPHYVPNAYIWGIFMVSGSEGWAVGGDRHNNTAEALRWDGNSWTGQPVAQCAGCEPRSVFIVNGGTGGDGWMVGTNAKLWRYQSGSWVGAPAPVGLAGTPTLNSIFMNNPGSTTNSGWAVGMSGTVIRYDSGTSTWTSVGPLTVGGNPQHQDLYNVFFKDSNHGWIVGAQNTILTTTDGGSTWSGGTGQVATVPAATILRSVFVDTYGVGSGNGDGWVVGDDGSGNTVMAHWNGGSWDQASLSPTPSTQSIRLTSVYLTSPDDGFAVGRSPVANSLSGIFHLDPPNPPTVYTTTTTAPTTSSTSTTSAVTSTTSSSITSTSSSEIATATTASTATTAEVSTSVSTSVVSTTAVVTQTVTTASSTTTPLVLPAIPGFPWESIIAGIVIGIALLGIARRNKRKTT